MMKFILIATLFFSTQSFAQDFYIGKVGIGMKGQKPQTRDAALEITKSPGESKFQFSKAQPKIKIWINVISFTLKETKPEKLIFGKFEVTLLPKPPSGKSVVREGVIKTGKTTSLVIMLETSETEIVYKISKLIQSKVEFTELYRLRKTNQTEYKAQKIKVFQ
jgi:hypothetical protein